ncbi:MAG: MFS transporter, partial [Gemmatimonadales bacterium]
MLGILALAELLGMAVWFAASAVAPELRERWGLSAEGAAWLTTVVQLGFVAGTAAAAVLNLADIIQSRRYFAVSALAAALANMSMLLVPSYPAALVARFFTGFF